MYVIWYPYTCIFTFSTLFYLFSLSWGNLITWHYICFIPCFWTIIERRFKIVPCVYIESRYIYINITWKYGVEDVKFSLIRGYICLSNTKILCVQNSDIWRIMLRGAKERWEVQGWGRVGDRFSLMWGYKFHHMKSAYH